MPSALLSVVLVALGMAHGPAPAQAQPAQAQPAQAQPATAERAGRPRIGLVLGGGGAKGAAHIGVLKVLEELRIPVDCIAGTSMGAIVGGAYATGMNATELERVITALDWREILASAPRQDIPVHRKSNDFAFTNGLELGLQDGKVIPPGGLVPTHQIEAMFRDVVASAAQTRDFDHLPIPFRAVATDLENGQMVVFDRGELALAMRASMAVPGAFAPVSHEGRLLVDGMLVRNLPVDVARSTCADVVIAVPVSNPKVTRDKLGTFTGVLGQAMNIAIEANENQQLASLTPRDVSIPVVLNDIGSGDFNMVPQAIPIGEAAARQAIPALSRYSVSPQEYAEWRAEVGGSAARQAVRIAEVRLTGTKKTNPDALSWLIDIRPGETYDAARADAAANRLMARGDFSSVGYGITEENGRNVLVFNAVEKPWGPNYLMFDINLSTDFRGDTGWGLRVDHERRWLNSLGGDFRASVQVGRPNILYAQFYQPVDARQRFFVAPSVFGTQGLSYLYARSVKVGQYDQTRYGMELDAGVALSSWGEVRLGVLRQGIDTSSEIANLVAPEPGHKAVGGVVARMTYDTIDKRLFPTQGTRAQARIYSSETSLGADESYRFAEFDVRSAFTRGRGTWEAFLRGGTGFGSNIPFHDQFKLGGMFNFSGYRNNELVGQEYGLAGLQYRRRLGFLNETLGTAAYGGATVEAGNVYQRLDGAPSRGVLFGGSLFVALDTKIGPVYLTFGRSEGGHSAVYLYLGSALESFRP